MFDYQSSALFGVCVYVVVYVNIISDIGKSWVAFFFCFLVFCIVQGSNQRKLKFRTNISSCVCVCKSGVYSGCASFYTSTYFFKKFSAKLLIYRKVLISRNNFEIFVFAIMDRLSLGMGWELYKIKVHVFRCFRGWALLETLSGLGTVCIFV